MTFFNKWAARLVLAVCLLSVSGSLSTAYGQKEYAIAEIQGEGAASPHVNENVRITGVVTALVKKGFYMQTPDDKADKNPKTSDAVYVYGEEGAGSVSPGDLVQVDGTVVEFRPRNQDVFLTITEISKPSVKVISKASPLPAPIVLTPADLLPTGKLDQMERFEAMRVSADMLVVGPTGGYTNDRTGLATSNGTFFAVIQGTPRPFREPGLDIWTKFLDKLPAATPAFDTNPEILRINSQEQVGGKALDVPAGATIKKLTGVVDYFKKFYTIVVDASTPPVVENIKGFVPVSAAGDREVTVGSFNIENFFDDETNSSNVQKEAVLPKDVFQSRLKKVSMAIRNVLAMPDILGVVEVENLKVLQKVAAKVNADAVAAGQPDPKYVAYLEEGNDVRGIDVGFLVKSRKIKVIETKQLGKDDKLDFPGDAPDLKLFDRTPLLLRAEVIDPKSAKPLAVTVIVNHLKSYLGIDDAKNGERTRNKRRLEAEWLANYVIARQKADPNERIVLCGDFNAFQFNDGYNDLMGIIKGKSDPNVLNPSKLAESTGLANLVEYIDPRNRYSYTYDGSAQAIDHVLINKPMRERLLKFGFARVDADFPLVWANDPERPERISDHDAPIVFLALDAPPPPKPIATPTP
ncbi:MAG: endonuclease/exonuclease/phosphatase family protein [Pyrinomonadaceae bacterium]